MMDACSMTACDYLLSNQHQLPLLDQIRKLLTIKISFLMFITGHCAERCVGGSFFHCCEI